MNARRKQRFWEIGEETVVRVRVTNSEQLCYMGWGERKRRKEC